MAGGLGLRGHEDKLQGTKAQNMSRKRMRSSISRRKTSARGHTQKHILSPSIKLMHACPFLDDTNDTWGRSLAPQSCLPLHLIAIATALPPFRNIAAPRTFFPPSPMAFGFETSRERRVAWRTWIALGKEFGGSR